jgi:uncharacterized membrane protein YgaE (UPF0421/DUF939 family)
VARPRELLRATARTRLAALRDLALPVGQTAAAAGLAWYVAHDAIGHPKAFFAPIAAVIAIGVAGQQYIRRVSELTVGVAVGIGVADVIISRIGTGVWQVAMVVGLSMTAAVLIGGGPLFITQAATSSVLVATLPGSHGGSRFVDALVGGAIGLGTMIVSPANPVRRARRDAEDFFADLSVALEAIADGLARRDVATSRHALGQARAAEGSLRRWQTTVRAGQETAALSPPYWRVRGRMGDYADAAAQLELVTRNVRVLARAATRASELDPSVPEELPRAILTLAQAARATHAALDHPDRSVAIEAALRAVELASRAYARDAGLPVATVVGQVRSTVTDLLTALGVERGVAVDRVRSAAGVPEGEAERPGA